MERKIKTMKDFKKLPIGTIFYWKDTKNKIIDIQVKVDFEDIMVLNDGLTGDNYDESGEIMNAKYSIELRPLIIAPDKVQEMFNNNH